MKTILLVVIISIFVVHCQIPHYTKQQITDKIGNTKIMYGATIRIKASIFTFHLHSHLVNYPQGSGFQSVTGMPDQHDYNSLWRIKQPHQQNVKTYTHQVRCGDSVRLEHALTRKNLHSEEIFQSMITLGQQVSTFGSEGNGNDNDNWIIKCVSKEQGQQFLGGDIFELVHENTEKYLKMSRYYQYSYSNWENCPFQGQLQISATSSSTKETQFKIVGGIFFHQKQKTDTPKQQQQKEQL